jgi:phage-related protein
MEKDIQIKLLQEAEHYFINLPKPAQIKLLKVFSKVQGQFPTGNFKKLSGSKNIWEFTCDIGSKFHRILAFWDSSEEKITNIICTHGFNKKSNKTPKQEIKKAEAIKNNY